MTRSTAMILIARVIRFVLQRCAATGFAKATVRIVFLAQLTADAPEGNAETRAVATESVPRRVSETVPLIAADNQA